MESNKEKILIAGDVKGKINLLVSKVNAIIKKCGPFDALFCVGDFFGQSNSELEQYTNGEAKVPIQTYVLGPLRDDQCDFYGSIAGCELAPNINYLGQSGVLSTGKGLKIAYISGVEYDNSNTKCKFSKEDVMKVRDSCKRGSLTYCGVDILLTSQWPLGVTELDKHAKYKPLKGSELLSWLVSEIMPRYHVCGLEGVSYERPPFVHLGDNRKVLTSTRFVALAAVGNPEKERFIYALNLKPLRETSPAEIAQLSSDQTPIPFRNIAEFKSNMEGNKQYFFQAAKKRPNQNVDYRKRLKTAVSSSGCWFCLSEPNVEKHLIISVGKHCYLALAKGGLVPDHLIISTIGHHESTVVVSESVRIEIFHFKEVLKTYFAKRNQAPVFFERNFKTVHLQIQVVPLPKSFSSENIKDKFQKAAAELNLKLEEYPKGSRCYLLLPPKSQYFHLELSDGTELIHRIDGNFPVQFGRDVLVRKDVLNMLNRADWHNCLEGKEKEAEFAESFRKKFAPFDFTLEDK